jgi:hypothetical protein
MHRDTTPAGAAGPVVQTRPMTLHLDDTLPTLTAEQTLTGWRREFCVELLGDGQARVFLRAVEKPSLKATELHRGVLFHRVSTAFADLGGFAAAAQPVLDRLVQGAARQQPSQDNLFAAVTYDRRAWEDVVTAVEQWQRRTEPGGLRARKA